MCGRIKYLAMDIDGTLTDGKIYMGEHGEIMKAFSVKDGYVFSYILKPENILPIVITARTSEIVKRRCEELGIAEVHQGKKNKLAELKSLIGEELGACAFFGDDVLDLECMRAVKKAGGIAGCPADAVGEVKASVDYVCTSNAGEGALREFCEWLVSMPTESEEELTERVEKYLKYLKNLDTKKLEMGRHDVNEDFYYCIQKYQTKEEKECKLESHRKYVDIQLVLQGTEAMDIADVSRLLVQEEYEPNSDVVFWYPQKRMARTVLQEGDVIILYPENAHRGAVRYGRESEIMKIVGKVRISSRFAGNDDINHMETR